VGVPIHDLDPLAPDPTGRAQWRRCLGLLLVLAAVAVICVIRYVQHSRFIGRPAIITCGPGVPLVETINPNTAEWTSLIRLPGIGETRARTIVQYRSSHTPADPNRPVFACPEDLLAIPGIGPTTLERLRPHLSFDAP
jgi:hypothetical protein